MKAILLVVLLLAAISNCEDDGDWVDTFKLPIDFLVHPYYAGYLNISFTQNYYYTYFPSENNTNKDPLIIRVSAGPGCSSLYSAYYSKGPFTFVKNTKNFRINPFNWNKHANVLFIEGPGEVGFSKGSDQPYNDDQVAKMYYQALLKFYQKFPELKDQTMYLTGQQYAGQIVPRIAEKIIEENRNPITPAWLRIKFGGFLLNNPCTEGDECHLSKDFSKFTIDYLRNHYFISEQVYRTYKEKCIYEDSEECLTVLHSIESSFLNTGSDIKNIYNQCVQQEGDIPCFDTMGINWFLNQPNVKETINADTGVNWKLCNPSIPSKWQADPKGSVEIYKKILREQHDIRIWIVSGSQSATVPVTGTKKWFEELKKEMNSPIVRMWEPWMYKRINAGNIEEIRGLSLITVRAGGYLLWNDQPQIASHILDSFISGIPL